MAPDYRYCISILGTNAMFDLCYLSTICWTITSTIIHSFADYRQFGTFIDTLLTPLMRTLRILLALIIIEFLTFLLAGYTPYMDIGLFIKFLERLLLCLIIGDH